MGKSTNIYRNIIYSVYLSVGFEMIYSCRDVAIVALFIYMTFLGFAQYAGGRGSELDFGIPKSYYKIVTDLLPNSR